MYVLIGKSLREGVSAEGEDLIVSFPMQLLVRHQPEIRCTTNRLMPQHDEILRLTGGEPWGDCTTERREIGGAQDDS